MSFNTKNYRFLQNFAFIFIATVTAIILYAYFVLPSASMLLDNEMQVPMRIYTADGDLIAEYGEKHRLPVRHEDIPVIMKKAIIAAEDHRFYQHHGVDFISIVRAVKELFLTGRKSQGASTITMQVARNFFLSTEKTYARKFNEILLSFKIELLLSKDQILELYLNKIFLGHRAYGIKAAARNYYGKDLDQIGLAQFAMLAGLPKAPSTNNPISNPEKAMLRRNYVLANMLDLNYISMDDYLLAKDEPITEKIHGVKIDVLAPHVAEIVRQDLLNVFGRGVYTLGLKVYTTIDSSKQKSAVEALTEGVLTYDKRHGLRKPKYLLPEDRSLWPSLLDKKTILKRQVPAGVISVSEKDLTVMTRTGEKINLSQSQLAWALNNNIYGRRNYPQLNLSTVISVNDLVYLELKNGDWILSQNPEVDGALVSIRPSTGEILALNGSYHFYESNFNRATQAKRQLGSLFKPFVYSAALENGFNLSSVINDSPIVIKDTGDNEFWRPNNVNYKFAGPTSLRVDLAKSRNLVSVRLLENIGIGSAKSYIEKFGFVGEEEMPSSLSLALGAGVATPIQNTIAYSAFANGGYLVRPVLIKSILGQNDMPIVIPGSKYSKISVPKRIISEENAYLINSVLQDVIKKGTGRRALVLKRADLSGKTGTTNDQKDAWFCGYNQDIATTVWLGFDNSASLHEYAAQLALPIWVDYMRQALDVYINNPRKQPEGIINARVNLNSGLLTSSEDINSRFEIFDIKNMPEKEYSVNTQVNDRSISSIAELFE